VSAIHERITSSAARPSREGDPREDNEQHDERGDDAAPARAAVAAHERGDARRDGVDVAAVRARSADALVCRLMNRAVGVRTADCAPILLAIDDGSAVAAVHAGWRGAVGGVVEAAVAALGGDPDRIVAAVGPCIGRAAFEVGPEVVTAAAAVVGDDINDLVVAGVGDRRHLDLAGLCAALLKKAGVSRVDVVGGCTVEQAALYFSHRREHGHTGRQISAIARGVPPVIDAETFR
jgi:YfiH family protein